MQSVVPERKGRGEEGERVGEREDWRGRGRETQREGRRERRGAIHSLRKVIPWKVQSV